MTVTHKQLPIDQVVPGMVLSDQICNALGTVLLVSGTVLTEATLLSLHRHKIESLPILFEVAQGEDSKQDLQHQLARLDQLFRKHDQDDASLLLKNLLTQFRAGEAA
jgi:hypothetical protein